MVGTRSSNNASNTANDHPATIDHPIEEQDDFVLPDAEDTDNEDEVDSPLVIAQARLQFQAVLDESTQPRVQGEDPLNSKRTFAQILNAQVLADETFLGSVTEIRMLRQFDTESVGSDEEF